MTNGPLESRLRPMIDAQAHRGPDARGVWSDGRCALGHRRLSIIDLSEAGRQPMSNARGDIQITFNGEIYNFQQLRRELEGLGHDFRTRTDTEVIIYAYEQWGTGCLARLRGMFAFGIWDRAAAAALPGARPRRQKAALLRAIRRPFSLRLGNARAIGRQARSARS